MHAYIRAYVHTGLHTTYKLLMHVPTYLPRYYEIRAYHQPREGQAKQDTLNGIGYVCGGCLSVCHAVLGTRDTPCCHPHPPCSLFLGQRALDSRLDKADGYPYGEWTLALRIGRYSRCSVWSYGRLVPYGY
ncbi:hypothetical protein LY76DRAFT_189570 [Colletotrichum caudatum]|nr:hypothetical protein LY76DRAFT_189570 [Colletotrichum caudatum]